MNGACPSPTPTPTPTCTPAGTPGPWTPAAPYPEPIGRYGFATDALGRHYVISGVDSGAIVNTVRRYDPATNVWSDLASIPTGSEAPAAAYNAANNSIYVLGGFGGGVRHQQLSALRRRRRHVEQLPVAA